MSMFLRRKWLSGVTAGVLVSLSPALAWAGAPASGSITFSPDATSIPVLGGTMLILLALLLGVIAFLSLRRQSGGGAAPLLLAALAAGSLVSAVGGISLVSESHADFLAEEIVDPLGETLPVRPNALNPYVNNAGVPMNVSQIVLPLSGCAEETATSFPGACVEGAALPPGETCEIDCAAIQDG